MWLILKKDDLRDLLVIYGWFYLKLVVFYGNFKINNKVMWWNDIFDNYVMLFEVGLSVKMSNNCLNGSVIINSNGWFFYGVNLRWMRCVKKKGIV